METFKGWDIDVISSIVVVKFVKSLGYASIKSLWYMQPSVEAPGSVIKTLNCDADIRNFSSDVKGHREVDIFVEHNLQEQTVEAVDSDVEIIEGEKFNHVVAVNEEVRS